ncbi:MAG: DUF1360 domain-containing protein [Gammaproteobacteria bacterium]|nr:DUF1360 domain-containing protein [Gammaproteobacteria bacterium]
MILKLLLLTFITYRLAEMVSEEELPFGIMARIRHFVGERATHQYGLWWTLAELLSCSLCSGFWIAIGLGWMLFGFPDGVWYGAAVAGAQAFLVRSNNA